VVVDKSFLDSVKEEVIESCVDDEDDYFRGSVPVLVDFHEAVLLAKT
jgi:hypothetical protein